MDRFVGARISGRSCRVVGTVLVTALATVVPLAAAAGAADAVDLSTALVSSAVAPVTQSPIVVGVSVQNSGTATATNVVTNLSIPAGAMVVDHSDNCTATATNAACTFASVPAGDGNGSTVVLSFPTTGTRTVTSSAHADQPDADNASTAQLAIAVGNENADLVGTSETDRAVVGAQPTFQIAHQFGNLGPTAVGAATVTGSVTGGATIVPGSFNFFSDFFGPSVNLAATDCTVGTTTFTCAPVFSDGIFDAPQPFVFYTVKLPTTVSTVVASARLTGRGDPNHANDTSTVTVDVVQPAAEIFTQLTSTGPVAAATPFVLQGFVVSSGDIDAQNVVAVLQAPATWNIALPPGPLPTGVSCAVVASPHSMRCTRATFATGDSWLLDVQLTPPAGTGSGSVSLNVTTTTPEIGVFPNSATIDILYGQTAPTPALTVTPNTNLEDGDGVTFAGTGFPPGGTVLFCQGVITGDAPTPGDCGETTDSTVTGTGGAFSINVTLHRFLVVANRGVVDCAQPQTPCGLGALASGPVLVAPLHFAPKPPVTDPLNARIEGTVVDTNGQPVSGAPVYGYTATDSWVGSIQATTDSSGHYVLEAAEPGIAYRLVFGAPSGSGDVPEWYGGPGAPGVPSRSSAFVVRLGTSHPTLTADAVLTAGGSITGTVVSTGSTPVANVVVWAYLNDDRFVGSFAATTSADGTYRIEGVRAGTDVRIRFAPPPGSGLATEWFDNVASRTTAQAISVAAGTTTTANAQLAASP